MLLSNRFNISILAILLLSFFSACQDQEKLEASGTFSALCYNVAGLPQGISSSNPRRNMSLISPLLNDYDVVHVQEDFCFHDSLLLYNNHPYRTPDVPCIGDGLNTFSNFPIYSFTRVEWNDCAGFDCLSQKGFSYSKIEVSKGVTIDFYNVHCTAESTPESMAARRSNLFQLLDFIDRYSQNQAVIIMGDFNHKYTRYGDSTRVLLEKGFVDPWLTLIRENLVPAYGSSLDNCFPVNTSPDCEDVDKVFYRSSAEMKIEALSYQYGDDMRFNFQGDVNQPLSDHSPLFVTFSYEFIRE